MGRPPLEIEVSLRFHPVIFGRAEDLRSIPDRAEVKTAGGEHMWDGKRPDDDQSRPEQARGEAGSVEEH